MDMLIPPKWQMIQPQLPAPEVAVRTRTFRVLPRIPDRLHKLEEIAYNCWWTWSQQGTDLFRWIDNDLWEQTRHNPVLMLNRATQTRLEELSGDSAFLAHLDEVYGELADYLGRRTWYDQRHAESGMRVAFFSAEFGIHESLPIYSGGLGVLSGDILKGASQLGLPLAGVSLLYRQGYFSQYLNSDGWQQETYHSYDVSNLPVRPVPGEDGRQLKVEFPLGDRTALAAVWEIAIGHVRLLLLDTNLQENSPEDREITTKLYGGDKDMRIRQEILLGIGGLRALRAAGIDPTVFHINEGHSAFLIAERLRELMDEGLDLEASMEQARAGTVFTTHTPVPAGNEEFSNDLLMRYLGPLVDSMGIDRERFLRLGSRNGSPTFSMTVFGLKFSRYRNGVSELHGEVSRRIWKDVWPMLPKEDVPIRHVTNGVHVESWIADEVRRLLDRYLGPNWTEGGADEEAWRAIERIPRSELWKGRQRLRERLVGYARKHWSRQLYRMGMHKQNREETPVLNPDALTIGFARRFATYKRATLIFRDPDRLRDILTDPDRPVQIIFAGKAHPHDNGGKELIRNIMHLCLDRSFYGRVIYLEDYSIDMARYLVQGVDVWLNTPRRPMEASGTSGMKACINGAVHVSVPDGWWAEAYRPEIGWAIGSGEEYPDPQLQDQVEAKALYNIIENEIVPMYYDRSEDGTPRRWVELMQKSMMATCGAFSVGRTLRDYTEGAYLPAHDYSTALAAEGWEPARKLAAWRTKVNRAWDSIRIEEVEAEVPEEGCLVGDSVPVTVRVSAPGLKGEDLYVEALYGTLGGRGGLENRHSSRLVPRGREGDVILFGGEMECRESGSIGFTVRVMPGNPRFGRMIIPGMIRWEE
jgi:starch phosphorylase